VSHYKPYSSYKYSGDEWLGNVPAHWDVMPCRAFVDEKKGKNENGRCQDYLSLMANVGIIPYEEKGDVGNKKPDDLSKCKLVAKGDLVINSMNYGIGSYGLSSLDGVCSPVYIVLKPKKAVTESRFSFRIFENREFQSYAQSFGNGILAHRAAINWDILKNIKVGIPSKTEQISILSFLDRETDRIDALIEKKQRQIELLKEKRQAIITQVVTRGLDPDVPMKDSGVEWLGKVPEHWKVNKLRWLLVGSPKNGVSPQISHGEGVPTFSISAVRDRRVNIHEHLKYADIKPEDAVPYLVRKGDILLLRGNGNISYVGQCGIVDSVPPKGCIYPDILIRVKPLQHVCPEFLVYSLSSHGVRRQIEDFSKTAAGIWKISGGSVSSLKIVLPPLDEQQAIVKWLNSELNKINLIISKAEESVLLLSERRSALITAAVTGQIDVRGE